MPFSCRSLPMLMALCALLPSESSFANVFTVGPDGLYPTIQSGIDAAINFDPGNSIIKVESGYYPENPTINVTDKVITLSGSWDATFTTQSTNPNSLVNFGGGFGLYIGTHNNASVAVNKLWLSGAYAPGVAIDAYNGSQVSVTNNWITGNHSQHSGRDNGGGISAVTWDSAHLYLASNYVDDNSVGATGEDHYGGGVFLDALGQSSIVMESTTVSHNAVDTSAACWGGGLFAQSEAGADIYLTDIDVNHNGLADCGAGSTYDGPGGILKAVNTTAGHGITATRLRWQDNTTANTGYGVYLEAHNAGRLSATDMLVTGSTSGGLSAGSFDGSTGQRAFVGNTTIANNSGTGLRMFGPTTSSVNVLSWGNGQNANIDAGVYTLQTMTYRDPLFVDATNGDFHLKPGSPAIDYGVSAANVPSYMRVESTDLDGNPRPDPVSSKVDVGCFENQQPDRIFMDGFGS